LLIFYDHFTRSGSIFKYLLKEPLAELVFNIHLSLCVLRSFECAQSEKDGNIDLNKRKPTKSLKSRKFKMTYLQPQPPPKSLARTVQIDSLVRVLGDELRHPPRQFEIIKFGMR
jgi:hypothetical protein